MTLTASTRASGRASLGMNTESAASTASDSVATPRLIQRWRSTSCQKLCSLASSVPNMNIEKYTA
nr:hypothetical protein [Rhizobium sp. UBA1881]